MDILKAIVFRWTGLFSAAAFLLPVVLVPLVFSGSLNLNTIVIKEPVLHWCVVLMFAGLVFQSFNPANRFHFPTVLTTALLLLWAYLLVSSHVLAPHPRTYHEFLRWTAYILTALATMQYTLRKDSFTMYWMTLMTVSLVISAYAVLQSFEIDFFEWTKFEWELSDVRRVCGTLGNPDYLASFLVAVLPLTLVLLLIQNGVIRWAIFAVWVLEILALLFSYSRGGWVTAFVTHLFLVGALAYVNWVRKPVLVLSALSLRMVLCLLGLMVLFAVAVVLVKWDAVWAAAYRLANLGEGNSVSTRPYFYAGALSIWLSSPLTGVGLGNFALHFPQYRAHELTYLQPFKEFFVEHTHNEFLEILSETGVIGIALYAAVFFILAVTIWRAVMRNRTRENLVLLGIGFGVFALLFHNLFTVTLRHTPIAFMLWSLSGAAAGYAMRLEPASNRRPIVCIVAVWLLAAFAIPYVSYQTTRFYMGDALIRSSLDLLEGVNPKGSLEDVRFRVETALVALKRGEQLAPEKVKTYFQQGMIYNKWVRDYHQAHEAYKQLDGLQQDFTSTKLNLYVNRMQQAQWISDPMIVSSWAEHFTPIAYECLEDAQEWIESAIKNDPLSAEYHYYLGRNLFNQRKLTEAKAELEKAIEIAHRPPPFATDYETIHSSQPYLEYILQYEKFLAEDGIEPQPPEVELRLQN